MYTVNKITMQRDENEGWNFLLFYDDTEIVIDVSFVSSSFCLFLQLEDIAIIPAQLNPALNHVECIVEEKLPGFELQRLKKTFPHICWAFLVFSLTAGYFVTVAFVQLLQERKTDVVVKGTLAFSYIVVYLGFFLSILAIVYGTRRGGYQMLYPSIHLYFIGLTLILGYFYCRVSLEYKNQHLRIKLAHMYPGSFVMIHSILWMMVGMITEPYWAIPLVTSQAAGVRLSYLLLDFSYSPDRDWDIRDKTNLTLLFILSMSVLSVQFFFLSVGSHNKGLISCVIPVVFIVISTYRCKLFNSSKSREWNNTACLEMV